MKKLIASSVILLLAVPAWAMPGAGSDDLQVPEWRQEIGQKMHLSEEQQTKLKGLKDRRFESQKRSLQLQIERLELKHLMQKEDASESDVLAQLKKVNDLQAEINSARVNNFLTLKRTLTPKQLETLRSSFKEHFNDRRGNRGEAGEVDDDEDMHSHGKKGGHGKGFGRDKDRQFGEGQGKGRYKRQFERD